MTTVADIMTRVVIRVTPDQRVSEAEAAMKRGAVRHLAVVDAKDTLIAFGARAIIVIDYLLSLSGYFSNFKSFG